MKYVKIYLLIVGMSVVAAFGVYMFFPGYKPQLWEEDRLVENLSAIIFLLVFITGFLFYFKSDRRRKTLLFLSSLGLLGFLDELSFGERIYGFQIPGVHGVGIDAAHDFFALGFIICMQIAHSYPVYLYAFIGLGIIIMITITTKYRYRLKKVLAVLFHEPSSVLALAFVTLISLALIIDLELVRHKFLFILEELFEMDAAIALLFCCYVIYTPRPTKKIPN